MNESKFNGLNKNWSNRFLILFLLFLGCISLININLYFYKKNLTNNKSKFNKFPIFTNRIVNKMIFVIIKKFIIFQKPWERGGIGRRTALKMRHLRVCRFKSDRSHFDEYL